MSDEKNNLRGIADGLLIICDKLDFMTDSIEFHENEKCYTTGATGLMKHIFSEASELLVKVDDLMFKEEEQNV